MSRVNSTRERIRDATAELMRVQGYAGTGLKQISTTAEAPFGSIYHFYPGGKEELAEEVIRTSGAAYGELFDALLGPAPDLLTGITTAFEHAAQTLADTDYADACPIATVALEVANTNEPLRRAHGADAGHGRGDQPGGSLRAGPGAPECRTAPGGGRDRPGAVPRRVGRTGRCCSQHGRWLNSPGPRGRYVVGRTPVISVKSWMRCDWS
jgi:hypothetical protein